MIAAGRRILYNAARGCRRRYDLCRKCQLHWI